MSPLGGTKFVLAALSGLGTFYLCVVGRIDGSVYMATTAAIVGGYITGDVLQRKNDRVNP